MPSEYLISQSDYMDDSNDTRSFEEADKNRGRIEAQGNLKYIDEI